MDYRFKELIEKGIPTRGDRARNTECYDFPLENIIYLFMKSANIIDVYGGISGLERLYNEYVSTEPIAITLQELLRDQWIRMEFGEWQPTLQHLNEEDLENIENKKLRDSISFLLFLREKDRKFCKKAIINNPQNIINEFKGLFPAIPNLDWFVEKGLLMKSNDGYAFQNRYWGNSDLMNIAAAKLWIFSVDHKNSIEKMQWLNLISACNVTLGTLKYLDSKNRADLLQLIIEVMEQEKRLGNYDWERKFITRLILSEHVSRITKINYEDINGIDYYPSDFIERLHFTERSYSDIYLSLYGRDKIHFFAGALFHYFSEIPRNYASRAANILASLHSTGYFSRPDVSAITNAESIVSFTQYEPTQFLSVFLVLSYIRADEKMYGYYLHIFDAMFDSILSGSVWANSYCKTDPAQVSLIIQYLISSCDFKKDKSEDNEQLPKDKVELYQKILELFINKIKASYSQTKDIILHVIQDIDMLIYCKDKFRIGRYIACLIIIAQKIYLSETGLRKDNVYNLILKILNKFYQLIWQNDGRNKEIYLSSSYWISSIWLDVFAQVSDDAEQRKNYLIPLTYADINNIIKESNYNIQSTVINNCILHIGILFSISYYAQRNQAHPICTIRASETQKALYSCLKRYQKNERFDIFALDYLDLFDCRIIFQKIASSVDVKHSGWQVFEKGLNNYKIEQIVLWYHFTTNDTVKSNILSILDSKIEQNYTPSKGIVHYEILISYICEHKLTGLYNWAIGKLSSHYERIKDSNHVALKDKKYFIHNQLYSLYYLQGNYEQILQGDNLFFKGVLYLEDENYNPLEACRVYQQLSKSYNGSEMYMNWLYSYILLMHDTIKSDYQQFEIYWTESGELIEKIDALTFDWFLEQRTHYVGHLLHRHEIMFGEDNNYLRTLEARYRVNLSSVRILKSPIYNEGKSELAKSNNIDYGMDLRNSTISIDSIRTIMCYSFAKKSSIYLQLKGINQCSDDEAHEIMLLKCILQTHEYMHNYSTQLYANKVELPEFEDRYTELYCEMFNHAYSEFLHVACNDQEKRGPTGMPVETGGGISSRDLTFKEDGQTISIGEAIFLKGINKSNIRKHITKMIASSNDYPQLFFMIYYHGDAPMDFCKKYKKFVNELFASNNSMLSKKSGDSIEFENSLLYQRDVFRYIQHLKIFCTDLCYDSGKNFRLYHIFNDIKNQWAVTLAKEGRI